MESSRLAPFLTCLLAAGLVTATPAVARPPSAAAPGKNPGRAAASHGARWLQEVLARNRYYIGDLDGRPGPMLRSAVRQFQLDHLKDGLHPTGHADAATLALLDQSR